MSSTDQFETRLDDDLALLTETLEEVLRSSGDPADQKYIELKQKAEQALEDVKNRVSRVRQLLLSCQTGSVSCRRLRA